MVTIQKYVKVQSLDEAYELNQNKNNCIIGGMLWLKMGNKNISTAIDLCNLGLDTIEESDDEFSIGAMVTLRQLENHAGLNSFTNDAIRSSVEDIVGVQFRNMATVGGSIWSRFGFSDVLTMFMAMDSYVQLYKGGLIPLKDFAKMDYDKDILVRLIVKKTPGKYIYKASRAQRTDFPVIACALSMINGKYQLAVGARPNKAVLTIDADNILAGGINEESAKAFARFAADNTPAFSNSRASGEYRTHLIEVLTYRCLMEMGGLE